MARLGGARRGATRRRSWPAPARPRPPPARHLRPPAPLSIPGGPAISGAPARGASAASMEEERGRSAERRSREEEGGADATHGGGKGRATRRPKSAPAPLVLLSAPAPLVLLPILIAPAASKTKASTGRPLPAPVAAGVARGSGGGRLGRGARARRRQPPPAAQGSDGDGRAPVDAGEDCLPPAHPLSFILGPDLQAVSWSGANGGAGPARDLGSPARARAPELALSEQRSGRAASAFSPPRRRRAWGGGRGLRRPAKAVAAGAPRSLAGRCLLCSLPSPSLSARAGVVVGAACGPVPVAGCFFSPPQLAERGLSACFRIRWRSPLQRFFTP
ncbi:unnamed protein product [Urochloa humidicola]